MKKNILFIFGVRPEAIKLAPLIKVFKQDPFFDVKVCVTGQHREMLDQVLNFFSIIPDFDLDLMTSDQSLFSLTAQSLIKMECILEVTKPDLVFVQGDTTTVLTGSLAAFYKNVQIAHVEAGLRSHNKYSPYPEETNRVLTSHIANYHFVPTKSAIENLKCEGVTDHVYLVGNTVVDSLLHGLEIIKKNDKEYLRYFKEIDFSKKIILVTCHRRESFGEPFEMICKALISIADANPAIEIVYPVHLNPNIKTAAHRLLKHPQIKLIDPLEYPHLIWLMNQSYLVLTDSGGIQEEAPSLGKPVLVLRNVTERNEGIEAGTAKLVGTHFNDIIQNVQKLLSDENAYQKMSKAINPYGDGTASEKILKIIRELLSTS